MDATIIEQNNKIIAEFMGIQWKPVRAGYSYISSVFISKYFDTQQLCLEYCNEINVGKPPDSAYFPLPDTGNFKLKYDSSWEWLMEVVEKIETLQTEKDGYFGVHISSNNCTIQGTRLRTDPENFHEAYFTDNHGETKIIATYITIVQFINWYNQLEK